MTKRQTKFGRRDVNGQALHAAPIKRRNAAYLPIPWGVQQLSWRRFAVRKNFSNGRRKLFNTCAWHDDTITAAVSFLSDPQEFAALIFPELDIEVLALNLQFFRLDDVVHFALRPPSLGSLTFKWKKNRRSLGDFLTVVAGQNRGELSPSEGCRAVGST